MSPNISLYFRLLKDLRSGLELLHDVSKEVACPYLSDLTDSLDSYNRFFDLASRDILSYDRHSSIAGTN